MTAKKLRLVFMGTPDFAVASLRRLVEEGYNIVAVVTAPDKPAGRGLKPQQSAVKKYAEGAGLRILQPEKLKDPVFVEEFQSLDADLGIVIAFRMLPEVIWSAPRLGTFNLHASLLPQYRGAAPINRAVMNGEKVTGVTTFMLKHAIDEGDIIASSEVPITEDDTAGTLHDKLMETGVGLVVDTVEAIAAGNVVFRPQPADTEGLKPAPKIFREDCLIRWDRPVDEIYDHIRGLSPYPAAWSYLIPRSTPDCVVASVNEEGEKELGKCRPSTLPESLTVKIYSAEKEHATHTGIYGHIGTDGKTYIRVSCKGGYIYIKELQAAGKKRMETGEFLRGFKDLPEYSF